MRPAEEFSHSNRKRHRRPDDADTATPVQGGNGFTLILRCNCCQKEVPIRNVHCPSCCHKQEPSYKQNSRDRRDDDDRRGERDSRRPRSRDGNRRVEATATAEHSTTEETPAPDLGLSNDDASSSSSTLFGGQAERTSFTPSSTSNRRDHRGGGSRRSSGDHHRHRRSAKGPPVFVPEGMGLPPQDDVFEGATLHASRRGSIPSASQGVTGVPVGTTLTSHPKVVSRTETDFGGWQL